jgi:hypothetical protein
MVHAREAVGSRSWSHPQEPTGEEWWADVLADPRGRKRERRTDLAVKQAFYRLADEPRETILVACSKCDWRGAFSRDDLIASHGADYAMPNLLNHLAAPNCSRLGPHWDRCGCITSSQSRAADAASRPRWRRLLRIGGETRIRTKEVRKTANGSPPFPTHGSGMLPARAIIMEHHGGLFDKDETKHSVVVTLNCHH